MMNELELDQLLYYLQVLLILLDLVRIPLVYDDARARPAALLDLVLLVLLVFDRPRRTRMEHQDARARPGCKALPQRTADPRNPLSPPNILGYIVLLYILYDRSRNTS